MAVAVLADRCGYLADPRAVVRLPGGGPDPPRELRDRREGRDHTQLREQVLVERLAIRRRALLQLPVDFVRHVADLDVRHESDAIKMHAPPDGGRGRAGYPLPLPSDPNSSTDRKASCGTSIRPTCFIRFLPSFCFSSSLRLRVMSPP